MKKLVLPPPTKRSAKDFLLFLAPEALNLFDAPKNILGFNVQNIISKQVYAMSEETAKRKLDRLKEMLAQW